MKKYLLALITFATCLSQSSTCEATEGVYGRFLGGANWVEHLPVRNTSKKMKMKTGFFGGIAAGYGWRGLRFEAELALRNNDIDSLPGVANAQVKMDDFDIDATIKTTSYFVNAIYELPLACNVKPYVGFGLGYARSKLKLEDFIGNYWMEKANDLAYQGILGATVPLSKNIDFSTEYRYFSGTRGSKNVKDHTLAAGLGVHF